MAGFVLSYIYRFAVYKGMMGDALPLLCVALHVGREAQPETALGEVLLNEGADERREMGFYAIWDV